jgi:arsenate reductase (glutaredoxin)
MNIQVIGTKKNAETRKAERFFKERRICVQFVDLEQRSLSQGELKNISSAVPAHELIDSESKEYKKKGLSYMEFDIFEELLENNLLLKQPVVRFGKEATVGYDPETWNTWIEEGNAS